MYLFKSWGGGGGVVPRDGGDPDCEPRDSHCGPELCEWGSVAFLSGPLFPSVVPRAFGFDSF